MKKISQLKDGAKFKLSKASKVSYWLNKIDKKRKVAIYTSIKSKRTFESELEKGVWPV